MRKAEIRSQTFRLEGAQKKAEDGPAVLVWAKFSRFWRLLGSRPALVFVLLSCAFGSLVSVIVPPLRGPDEIAHFLRIYSYTRGELFPIAQAGDRKGILVGPQLYGELSFFKNAGERFAKDREQGLRYGKIMNERPHFGGTLQWDDHAATLLPFAGTEGYSPIAYAPYIPAAIVGNLLALDFPNMLVLMRLFGVLAFTAVAAYAITVMPTLKWAFVLIAMLPVSLYNRSVLSADGAALAYALVITALCFRAVYKHGRVWERSLWMTLCALSKPVRRWRNVALVIIPSFIFSPLWVIAVSGEIGAWRLLESETYPREHFDPLWKLGYIWEHPLHFPLAAWNAVTVWGNNLWPELIGILGWQDIPLQRWNYVALTILLFIVPLQKLNVEGAVRVRVAVITGLAALGYVVLVYLIFFITYTPISVDHVRGVQGRYFVIALPTTSIFLAAMINLALPRGTSAMAAIAGGLFSGIATINALFEAHWLQPHQ
jgi:Predicted membrane protein (DUF2142)